MKTILALFLTLLFAAPLHAGLGTLLSDECEAAMKIWTAGADLVLTTRSRLGGHIVHENHEFCETLRALQGYYEDVRRICKGAERSELIIGGHTGAQYQISLVISQCDASRERLGLGQ